MFFRLRFDFRNPSIGGTSMAERYAAALDMVEWADGLGCLSVNVAEHHGSVDGYLPSPLPMLAAMTQRSKHCRLRLGALVAPFYDPLRMAEDIVVVDNLSRGRVDVVVAAGYAREEFAMFAVPMTERVKRVTEAVHTLRSAFSGEPFEFRGRRVQVTPPPFRPGGPKILLGGSSEGAARRAARIADGFVPSIRGAWTWYRDEMIRLGKPDPGPSAESQPFTVVLANDLDRGWEQMAPFFLHEMNAYGGWQAPGEVNGPYFTVAGIEGLRAAGQYRVMTPEQLIADIRAASYSELNLHPLCGGMPPDLAWESLRLFEHEVLPAFPPDPS
jgi:alkanesulfonate monooxygenase SsuD/methylene tetrahydromethanopterin reductase-like flavin-dependent oxidoreductase (luciferase family)